MTIHFIYVKGDSIGTPFAITNELSARLSQKYPIIVYDWQEKTTIYPAPGDILLGHPHPIANTIYRRSFRQQGWSKRILLCPFAHAIPEYIAFLDETVCEANCYLAICGEYWTDTIKDSIVSHWLNSIRRIDLAVRSDHFPFMKTSFNPPGQRLFVTVGRLGENKGSDYLACLARSAPDLSFSWIGGDKFTSSEVQGLGAFDFRERRALDILAKHDFIIQCGRSDANPTTLLEGASLGLIPVCTPQSGYYNTPWIINIPLDNIDKAIEILRGLNSAPECHLIDLQFKARADLENHFNWDRFAEQVIATIECPNAKGKIVPTQDTLDNRVKLKLLAQKFEAKLLEQESSFIKKHFLSRIKRKFSTWSAQ